MDNQNVQTEEKDRAQVEDKEKDKEKDKDRRAEANPRDGIRAKVTKYGHYENLQG